MAWVRGDDGAKDNRRVLRAGLGGYIEEAIGRKDYRLERLATFSFVALCVAWSAAKYTDLFIPEYVAQDVAGEHMAWLVKAAIKAQFLGKRSKDEHGDYGWQVLDNGDNLFHIRTWDEVQQDRNREYNSRLSLASLEIQARDGDNCRYCLCTVTPLLHKGGDNTTDRSRTLDHVDPFDPETTDRVVACRGCNRAKGRRTPQEAEMRLYPPPEDRGAATWYHPKTRATFVAEGYDHLLRGAKQEQSNDQSKSKATREAEADQEQEQTESGVRGEASPGRDGRSVLVGPALLGSGRDGSGQPAPVVPLHPVRDSPDGAA